MPFNTEGELENHVRGLIQNQFAETENFICLDSKSIVDITICKNLPPELFLIEAKLYNPNNNRINIGRGDGTGIQTEILRERPAYLEDHLLWLLARTDENGYILVNNAQLTDYVYQGIALGQQNNIQSRIFNDFELLNDEQLINEILAWIN